MCNKGRVEVGRRNVEWSEEDAEGSLDGCGGNSSKKEEIIVLGVAGF